MNVKFDEEKNSFTVDMTDTYFLAGKSVEVTYDPSTAECECTPKVQFTIESDNIIDAKDLTIWNLLFNSRIKNLLKQIKK